MSTELVAIDYSQLPSTQLGTDDGLMELARSADFLSRLQLCGKGGYIDRGLIKPGHYGIPISAEEIEDLGDTIDVLPFARKPKALDMTDKEAIIVSYDQDSEEFQRIQAKAQGKDSGCMYGPSFLVYERSTGRFLEFFCGSKSARKEASKLYPFCPLSQADINAKLANGSDTTGMVPHGPQAVTLKSRLAKQGSFTFWVPVVGKCSTPFTTMPSHEAAHREITRFLTAKADTERAPDETGKKARAR